jgi:hypothetical protein
MVSPQYDFANVVATEMIGQMTLNIGSSWMVSHQCELLKMSANEMIVKRICTLRARMGFLPSVNS